MAFVYWIHLDSHSDIKSEGYVGITTSTPEKRFKQHILKSKRDKSTIVSKAIFKYKSEIKYSVICECSLEYALWLEENLRPVPKIGWNIVKGGCRSSVSDFSKDKISKSLAGIKKPKHVLDAMNNARLSKPVSQETRDKLSKSLRGKKRTKEQIENLKIAARKRALVPQIRTKESIQKSIETFNSKHPLDLPNLNLDVWLNCLNLYVLFLEGKSRYVASKEMNCSKGSLVAMWKRFNSGWNPNLDQRILDFVNSSTNSDNAA